MVVKDLCVMIGCGEGCKVKRQCQLSGIVYVFEVFIGCIGFGNGVMKLGVDCDCIVMEYNMVVFEMEGVGVWDEIFCMFVKGLCDYVDSYKNKDWQDYVVVIVVFVVWVIID